MDPGQILAGRYRIESYLAQGGMGQVYKADDLILGVPIALKTIRPEIASNPSSLRSFTREVLLARSVTHPNVCRIYDISTDPETEVSFLTMEFLPGETLSARLQGDERTPTGPSLDLIRQLAEALDAAHRAGVVHRDFKSPNVMIVPAKDGERAVITDFGLAITLEDDDLEDVDEWLDPDDESSLEFLRTAGLPARTFTLRSEHAAAGRIAGTPEYMSPEQLLGGRVGPASDLYAFGVVLFEMATGRLPFVESDPAETAAAQIAETPPTPSSLAELDPVWDKVILRLLSKNPEERFATAMDAVSMLEDGSVVERKRPEYRLPAERDAFIGRASELSTLSDLLEGDSARPLLTLLGPGGGGKTRLAQKYAWDTLENWPGGAWMCDLSEARSATGIRVAVAKSLDVPLDDSDPNTQLGHAIAARGKCLIILDNFEQLVDHAHETLGSWMQLATEASFLVTSRERLRLAGESIFEVGGLSAESEAVELFGERARVQRAGLELSEDDMPLVQEIVTKLDGLPLAIELAASRVGLLNLEQLNRRLDDRFRILSGGPRGRHETLRAALDWSWELLEPVERVGITQAAAFDGGFTLDAAESVIDLSVPASRSSSGGLTSEVERRSADGTPSIDEPSFATGRGGPGGPASVLDVIQSLVDKSWIRTTVVEGAPRFQLYATIQEYAADRLGDSAAETHLRHGRYFAAMGSEGSLRNLHAQDGLARSRALQYELGNLTSACRRALTSNEPGVAVACYCAIREILELTGPLSAALELGREVLESAANTDHQARALFALAQAEASSGILESARQRYHRALATFRKAEDDRSAGATLHGIGITHFHEGNMEDAARCFEEALVLHRQAGDQLYEGITLGDQGVVFMVHGQADEAKANFERALEIHRRMKDRQGEGSTLNILGSLLQRMGQLQESKTHHETALAIHREAKDKRSEGTELTCLGLLSEIEGRLDEAQGLYESAIQLHREMGDRRSEGGVLGNLAVIEAKRGNYEAAIGVFSDALRIHRELRNVRQEGIVLGNLGAVLKDAGRFDEAREHLNAALSLHIKVGSRSDEAYELGNLGKLYAAQNDVDEAVRHFEAAATTYREIDDPYGEGLSHCRIAETALSAGRTNTVSEALQAASDAASRLDHDAQSELIRNISDIRVRAGLGP